MRTRIKTLTLCAATLAATAVAGAHDQPRQERANRKPDGFQCSTCGSPCVSRAALQRKIRTRRLQHTEGRQFQANRPAQVRQQTAARGPESQRPASRQFQRGKQQTMRFDIDGDGQFSNAEKAARRAYRNALDRKQGVQQNERPASRPPVE
jgi:hypothetical protein